MRTAILLGMSLVFVASSVLAATPAQLCQKSKLGVAGKLAMCLAKERGKAAIGKVARIGHCSAKAASGFARSESQGGCTTIGDGSAITVRIFAAIAAVDAELTGAPRYTDNGDGTVTDALTGLQWEKKVNGNATADFTNPHDADNYYSFSVSANVPNGTLFTDFLVRLNDRCRDDGSVDCSANGDADCSGVGGPCGFAGHRDWRMPTSAGGVHNLGNDTSFTADAPELESIIDPTIANCGTIGVMCMDPIFGVDADQPHISWSGSIEGATTAWSVQFHYSPGVLTFQAGSTLGARAVRDVN